MIDLYTEYKLALKCSSIKLSAYEGETMSLEI